MKNKINLHTKESRVSKSKSTYIKLGAAVAILSIGIGGAFFSGKES